MADCGCREGIENVERKTLWLLMIINGSMFFAEAAIGWLAESTGLLSDSLDMLADAMVYGVSLYAVGRSSLIKRRAAALSGWIQIVLGIGVLIEVVRRLISGSEPVSELIIAMGCVALFANLSCLLLLAKHRKGEVHMRASWIFSTNDVIANVGVILSGVLILWSGSRLPDLLIGAFVSMVVVRGGCKILQEARMQVDSAERVYDSR